MQIPINCPICNSIMMNDFYNETIRKKCESKLNHEFHCSSYAGDKLSFFTVVIDRKNRLSAQWQLGSINRFFIIRGNLTLGSTKELPFFIPDFSNYSALVNKIKLYTLLS
jgi:hypothetical protein